MIDPLATVADLLARAHVPYAVIGAHAVNVWLEPRFTADVDVAVQATSAEMQRLKQLLAASGYMVTREHGAGQPSGPDFVRFSSADGSLVLELQTAKTALQREVIRRAAAGASGPRIATVEDLIVMKLIANRPKDRADLDGLVRLPAVDWPYVERWAAEWDVVAVLRAVRAEAARA
ncbi:MAG: hypothetical protein ACREQL_15490 [Candidatus Binatia bacterium]